MAVKYDVEVNGQERPHHLGALRAVHERRRKVPVHYGIDKEL